MKNKGFTLLEIIGVVVILGLVAVFSVPALTKTFRDSADKQYDDYIKDIKIAAESYFHSETDGAINDNYTITIEQLVQKGYYKKRINPKTNKEPSNDITINITKNEDGTENYEVIDLDVTRND